MGASPRFVGAQPAEDPPRRHHESHCREHPGRHRVRIPRFPVAGHPRPDDVDGEPGSGTAVADCTWHGPCGIRHSCRVATELCHRVLEARRATGGGIRPRAHSRAAAAETAAVVMLAALPIGANVYLMSRQFGVLSGAIASAIVLTTAIAALSMPVILTLIDTGAAQ